MTESEKFIAVRTALGFSQRGLSNELGTSQAIISAVETGKKSVSRKHLELLQKRFKLNTDWFLNGRGEMFGKAVDISTITGTDKDEIIRILKEQNHILMLQLKDKERIIRLLEKTQQ